MLLWLLWFLRKNDVRFIFTPLFCRGFMLYLCYLYLFIYYGAQTRFPHQMMFVSLNSNTTGAISGTETPNPSRITWVHFFFKGEDTMKIVSFSFFKEKVNLFYRTKCGTTNNNNINYLKNITNILFYFIIPFLNTSQILRLSVLCVYNVVFQIHICNIILTMKYYHTVTKTMLINF